MSTNASSSKQKPAGSGKQPKDKTNNEWLHDNGYKSLHEFCIIYGFKPHDQDEQDAAARLVESFKEDQQEEWEAAQKSSSSNSTTAAKKTSQEDIDLAILWHNRMGHVSWETVKRLPAVAQGVPELNFRIEDMPPCDVCVQIHGPKGAAREPDF